MENFDLMLCGDDTSGAAALTRMGPPQDRSTVAIEPAGNGGDATAPFDYRVSGFEHGRTVRLSHNDVNPDRIGELRCSQWRPDARLRDFRTMDASLLKTELQKPGRSQAELARVLGFPDPSYVNKMATGRRAIKAHEAEIIRAYLAKTAAKGEANASEAEEHHIGNTPDLPPIVDRSGVAPFIEVPEYDLRLSAGPGSIIDHHEAPLRRTWTMPRWLIVDHLGLNPDDVALQEVVGDSMSPTLNTGDYVLIDRRDRRIGLPGIFAVWDGDALVCKRLERIPGSQPTLVRIKSDNPLHGEYAVPADQVDVKGRLRWVMRRA